MRSSPTPAQWLVVLLALAAGVWGWIYGLTWKRVAQGVDTSHQERLLMDLQDQLITLREENDRLAARLRAAEGAEQALAPAATEAPAPESSKAVQP